MTTWRTLRLDADDPKRGFQCLRRDGNSSEESSAAHTDGDGVDVRTVLHDLQPYGTLARDDIRIAERVNVVQPMGFPIFVHCGEDGFHRRRKPCFRSVFFDRRDFGWDGILRHENDAAHPGNPGRIGETLAMISGGEGNDAPLALLRTQTKNGIERAARLECAGALQVLGLETEPRAGQSAQCRRVEERSAVNVRRDAGGGRPDVIERDGRGLHPLIGSAGLARRGGDFLRSGHLLQHSSLPSARRCRP